LAVNQTCPVCGSTNISKKSSEYLISTPLLKKLILIELLLIAFILTIVTLRYLDGPIIRNVDVDIKNHSIQVITKASIFQRKLEYSFDNGKTYQTNSNLQVQQPGTYAIVIRNDKDRKSVWQTPITFTENDFDMATTALIIHSDAQPPHITGVEPINESIQGINDGQIVIHIIDGKKPIRYSIDGGLSFSDDSIFSNLEPGRYSVYVIDDDSQIDTWPDPVLLSQGSSEAIVESRLVPPSLNDVETLLNRLFSDPENDTLRDSLQSYFISQTMNVDCELIGIPPNTPYQLFQFLQRRYEGQPGSKRIEVLDIGYNDMNRVNKLRIRESRVSTHY